MLVSKCSRNYLFPSWINDFHLEENALPHAGRLNGLMTGIMSEENLDKRNFPTPFTK